MEDRWATKEREATAMLWKLITVLFPIKYAFAKNRLADLWESGESNEFYNGPFTTISIMIAIAGTKNASQEDEIMEMGFPTQKGLILHFK